jgi:hypothetical protein
MAVRFVREEAAMAAITFNTAYQKQHARAQLDTIFAALREMFDAFVSNRMQRAAAEAEYARPRPYQGKRTHQAGLQ